MSDNKAVVTALNAATSTGAGNSVRVPPRDRWQESSASEFTFQIVTTGSPTTVTIGAEGSLDDITWDELAEHTVSGATDMFHVVNRPVAFVRPNLKTLTGGTSPTVTIKVLYKV